MAPTELLYIDTIGIQEYVFGSNHLAQNVGASERVAQATRDWIFEALDRLKLTHNARRDPDSPAWIIDEPAPRQSLQVEVIYAGGGNAAILFESSGDTTRFTNLFSRRVLEQTPGLGLRIHRAELDWSADKSLALALEAARREAGDRSRPKPVSLPPLGLGVTAACDFTAQPVFADYLEPDGTPRAVARTVMARLGKQTNREPGAVVKAANTRLRNALSNVSGLQPEDKFVFDFDQFGSDGESSYIAVIHADGNGMGQRVQALSSANNAECAAQLRKFSRSVEKAAQLALSRVVSDLVATRRAGDKDKDRFAHEGAIPAPKGYVPFRPIVFGGDDVTFVCDGRLGLTLAAAYLEALQDPKAGPDHLLTDGQPLASRAGVAIVKNHFPFARAYRLAADLADNAKHESKDLDWHVATSGLLLDLDDLRAREYTSQDGQTLLMRPVTVGRQASEDWRTWQTFRYLTEEFQSGSDWGSRRNKVKDLRGALRAGPGLVELFLASHPRRDRSPSSLPDVAGVGKGTGWVKDPEPRCVHFDAIEAIDFFVSLRGRGA